MILNLGCGNKLLPGAINVDITEPNCDLEGFTFVKHDIINYLETFPIETASEIHLYYILEHLSFPNANYLTFLLNKSLKMGGRVVGVTDDFESIVERYYPLTKIPGEKGRLERLTEMHGLLWELYDEENTTFHKSIWTKELLDFVFMKDGFKKGLFSRYVGARSVGIFFTFKKKENLLWDATHHKKYHKKRKVR